MVGTSASSFLEAAYEVIINIFTENIHLQPRRIKWSLQPSQELPLLPVLPLQLADREGVAGALHRLGQQPNINKPGDPGHV